MTGKKRSGMCNLPLNTNSVWFILLSSFAAVMEVSSWNYSNSLPSSDVLRDDVINSLVNVIILWRHNVPHGWTSVISHFIHFYFGSGKFCCLKNSVNDVFRGKMFWGNFGQNKSKYFLDFFQLIFSVFINLISYIRTN